MSNNIFIFFVRSDFHYIICKSIIREYGISTNNCFFKIDRGVKLDEGLMPLPIILEKLINLPIHKRILFYISNKKQIDYYIGNKSIKVYTPFVLYYPSRSFGEIAFFEEGFSSYFASYAPQKRSFSRIIKSTLIYIIFKMLFKGEALRAFMGGFCFYTNIPSREMTLFTTSPNAYASLKSPLINKKVLSVNNINSKKYDFPKASYLLVLDRFSEGGRPYSLENYLKCLQCEIDYIEKQNVSKAWIKFHPADDNNEELKSIFYNYIKGGTIFFEEFEGKLEYLALQDIETCFIGTNSTILYYAPIYGKTNKSVSFSKKLASIDNQYNDFLKMYGGVESFVKIFSKNVQCL